MYCCWPIFENFRDSCITNYGLDPAYYYTLLSFTWDAMLKYTRVNFELLTDVVWRTWYRGGLSQCSNRYTHAKNKYMRSYDSSTYLIYYDVNNLYGWAKCQPLPYADFCWIDDIDNFDVMNVALDSPMVYILEVDLEYPQHVHDAHSDLFHFVQRARNHSVNERRSSLRHCMIKSVTSYIIAICSNVLVTVSALQRSYTRNLHGFANTSNSIQILGL